jgi:hypothetical protein
MIAHPMIVVSGTRRSGTSMWMQVLAAAGLPIVGERYPLDWETALGPLNRRGFFESTLRDGINYTTNPDPRSGVYLHPVETRCHVVKLFADGLVRSDLSFLDRVLVTVRPWREVAASFDRLIAIENVARGVDDHARPPRLSGALDWWRANFGVVRDVVLRRYAVHIQSHRVAIEQPERVVPKVLAWIAEACPEPLELDVDAAIAAVDATERTIVSTETDDTIEPDIAAVFDAYEQTIADGSPLDTALLERMNAVNERLAPRYIAHGERLAAWLVEHANAPKLEPLAL